MNDEQLITLIQTHLARYPEAEILDVYKLLHQGAFGPGHLVTNRKIAQEWLEYEINILDPAAAVGLVENIHPTGEIVRVHLGPYVAHKGNVKRYLDAFVRSAKAVEGDPAALAHAWEVFEALCESDAGCQERFVLREVHIFGDVRARESWPAVHHSPAYNAAYDPHYRLMTRAEAAALCERENMPFEVV